LVVSYKLSRTPLVSRTHIAGIWASLPFPDPWSATLSFKQEIPACSPFSSGKPEPHLHGCAGIHFNLDFLPEKSLIMPIREMNGDSLSVGQKNGFVLKK